MIIWKLEGIIMSGSEVRKIIEKVVEAHGGASRWRKLEAVEAIISVRGFLFKAKRRPIRISMELKFRPKEGSCLF
jgi:hypothetical protein